MGMAMAEVRQVREVLAAVLRHSSNSQFKGFNKHDGLNSPILKALLGWSKWSRIVAIQTVMRSPINIRPLLLVPRTYNPKGLSLFAQCYLDLAQCGETDQIEPARSLLKLLGGMTSPGPWAGSAWGYHYPWQDLGFFAPSNTPNAVVSCFVCESYLKAYRVTHEDQYLDAVTQCLPFFLNDLPRLLDSDDALCLGYMPMPMRMRVMDVSILVAAVLAQHANVSGDSSHLNEARRLINYVCSQQTDEGAWWYTDPPEDSPIGHDNYHTGFILDALARYMTATGDHQWQGAYDRGLAFYRERLFAANGAPRWMSDREYPHDIHGAAQGILTFSRHLDTDQELVERIIDWSLHHMYHPDGYFYYQQRRHWTIKTHLLRWCNGWMARALGAYLAARRGVNVT